MEIYVQENKRLVELWLTREEQQDQEIKRKLEGVYSEGKEQGWMVAVFLSGREELSELTSVLLRHNRDKLAQQEVQRQQEERKGA